MTDDSKATPRPWLVERYDQDDGSINYEVWCQNAPHYHRVVTLNDDANEHALADTKLIVAAVNAHDALVAERDDAVSQRDLWEQTWSAWKRRADGAEAERDRLRQALEEAQKAIRTAHEWIGTLPLTPPFDMKWEAQKSLEAAGRAIKKALHDV